MSITEAEHHWKKLLYEMYEHMYAHIHTYVWVCEHTKLLCTNIYKCFAFYAFHCAFFIIIYDTKLDKIVVVNVSICHKNVDSDIWDFLLGFVRN